MKRRRLIGQNIFHFSRPIKYILVAVVRKLPKFIRLTFSLIHASLTFGQEI